MIALQNELSLASNMKDVGKTFEVLVEGPSKRNPEEFAGRTSQNKFVVFPRTEATVPGALVQVRIDRATSATLFGGVVSL